MALLALLSRTAIAQTAFGVLTVHTCRCGRNHYTTRVTNPPTTFRGDAVTTLSSTQKMARTRSTNMDSNLQRLLTRTMKGIEMEMASRMVGILKVQLS